MINLPKWILANPFPAVHDFESLTVLDQTARLYGAVNELITEYNKTVEQLKTYTQQETENREDFELKITKVMNEFMCAMETYLKTNLQETAAAEIQKLIDSGVFRVALVYDAETEALNMSFVTGGE